MKVALVAPSVFPINASMGYGYERALIPLCQRLAREHEVTLIAPKGSKVDGVGILETVDATGAWGKDEEAYGIYAPRLSEFDLIHSEEHQGLVLRYAAEHPRAKVIHTFNGLQTWSSVPKLSNVTYVAVSDFHREDLRSRYGIECEVVPNAVDLEAYSFVEEKQTESSYLLSLSLMARHKGQLEAIEVARRTGARLIVAGEDRFVADRSYVEEVKAACNGLPNVEYRGAVSHEEKVSLLQQATATLLPFKAPEADSLIAKESLACGTPVVATQIGAMPEIINHGRDGFLCKTVDDFVQAIESDTGIYPVHCREKAEAFSSDRQAQHYLGVYRNAMGERPRVLVLGLDAQPMPAHVAIEGREIIWNESGLSGWSVAHKDGSLDEVVMAHFLERFPIDDVPSVLREAYRVLRSGGKVTVDSMDLRGRVRRLLEKQRWGWEDIRQIYGRQALPGEVHMSGWTPELLCRALAGAGFKFVQVVPLESNVIVTGVKT